MMKDAIEVEVNLIAARKKRDEGGRRREEGEKEVEKEDTWLKNIWDGSQSALT